MHSPQIPERRTHSELVWPPFEVGPSCQYVDADIRITALITIAGHTMDGADIIRAVFTAGLTEGTDTVIPMLIAGDLKVASD